MKINILIVEDDDSLLQAIILMLEEENYKVDFARTGDEGLWKAESGIFDLLILDVMLPGLDGFSIIKELRRKSISTPTLFLTARDSVQDRVNGLKAGGDDYLVKPFAGEELLARVMSLLRRSGKLGEEGVMKYGKISVSTMEQDAMVNGERMKLTSKEYNLLHYLMQNREQIITREQIFERIWGMDAPANEAIVDLYIHYLRKKLAEFGLEYMIRTVRGVGYMLKEG